MYQHVLDIASQKKKDAYKRTYLLRVTCLYTLTSDDSQIKLRLGWLRYQIIRS